MTLDYCLAGYAVGVLVATGFRVHAESVESRSASHRESPAFGVADLAQVVESFPVALIFSLSWPFNVVDWVMRRWRGR